MTMEPDSEKVAWGTARTSLFQGKVSSAATTEIRGSFAVTTDRREPVHRLALSIRPAKWFGGDWSMNSFFARQDCAVPEDLSGVPITYLVCRTATDQNRLKID
jgi:hypothetical protein